MRLELLLLPAVVQTARGSGSLRGWPQAPSTDYGAVLHLNHDPRSPHAQGFEPRELGDDPFEFGNAHAVVRHVVGSVGEGDPFGAFRAFQGFSDQHQLGFGLDDDSGRVLERSVLEAAAMTFMNGVVSDLLDDEPSGFLSPAEFGLPSVSRAKPKPKLPQAGAGNVTRGLHVLILGPSLMGSPLRILPTLLRLGLEGVGPHEVVSIEHDADDASAGQTLFQHAAGADGSKQVRHTPLLPAPETPLNQTLQSLKEGYDFHRFDMVILPGNEGKPGMASTTVPGQLTGRELQKRQLEAVLNAGLLQPGAVVHAEGPAATDPSTERFLQSLNTSKTEFTAKVHALPNSKAAVVSTLTRHTEL